MINQEFNKYQKKKQILIVILLAFLAFRVLAHIHNSNEERRQIFCGTWQAQDVNHKNVVIKISPNKMEIDGEVIKFGRKGSGAFTGGEVVELLKDVSLKSVNNPPTYDAIIHTEETAPYYIFASQKGKKVYAIAFPNKNKNMAILIDSKSFKYSLQGTVLYAMNKETQPDYDEYVSKYVKNSTVN